MKEEEMLEPVKRFFSRQYRKVSFVEEPTLVHGRRGDLAVRVQGGGLHIVEIESSDADIWTEEHGFIQLRYFLRHANYLWLAIPEDLYYEEGPRDIMNECGKLGAGLLVVSGGPKRYRVTLKKWPIRAEGYMNELLKTYTNL